MAYCQWAGKRLPPRSRMRVCCPRRTRRQRYPWGDDLLVDNQHQCNIWQGQFPQINTAEDGYLGTAPAKSFNPNGYGLYQMAGNVWEWCLNPGNIPITAFQTQTSDDFLKEYSEPSDNPFATKGGSFLCHDSYCNRYRVAARNQTSAASSTSNLGFRCVR